MSLVPLTIPEQQYSAQVNALNAAGIGLNDPRAAAVASSALAQYNAMTPAQQASYFNWPVQTASGQVVQPTGAPAPTITATPAPAPQPLQVATSTASTAAPIMPVTAPPSNASRPSVLDIAPATPIAAGAPVNLTPSKPSSPLFPLALIALAVKFIASL